MTFIFALSVVISEWVLGLGIALLLKDAFPGVRILRFLVIIAMMISPIVSALEGCPSTHELRRAEPYLEPCKDQGYFHAGDSAAALISLMLIDVWSH